MKKRGDLPGIRKEQCVKQFILSQEGYEENNWKKLEISDFLTLTNCAQTKYLETFKKTYKIKKTKYLETFKKIYKIKKIH